MPKSNAIRKWPKFTSNPKSSKGAHPWLAAQKACGLQYVIDTLKTKKQKKQDLEKKTNNN